MKEYIEKTPDLTLTDFGTEGLESSGDSKGAKLDAADGYALELEDPVEKISNKVVDAAVDLFLEEIELEDPVEIILEDDLEEIEDVIAPAELIALSAVVNLSDYLEVAGEHRTALMYASEKGHMEIVKILVKKNFSGDLRWAIQNSNVKQVENLIAKEFKLSEVLAQYAKVAKGFVTGPIASELSKASNSKHIALISKTVGYLDVLYHRTAQERKTLDGMFAKWSKLSKKNKFAFHKLVQGELTKKQCAEFKGQMPGLYRFGQDVLEYVGKDTPKVLKFVSNFMKLNQQKMLPYKEIMISMLCLDKLDELNLKEDFEFIEVNYNNVVDLLKTKIITKHSNKLDKEIIKEFVEDRVHSEEIKGWLLNDFMKLPLEAHCYNFCAKNSVLAIEVILKEISDEKTLQKLLNYKDPVFGKTAVAIAKEQGHMDFLTALINKVAEVVEPEKAEEITTTLILNDFMKLPFEAYFYNFCAKNSVLAVKVILKEISDEKTLQKLLNYTDPVSGKTAAEIAGKKGHNHLVTALIDKLAEIKPVKAQIVEKVKMILEDTDSEEEPDELIAEDIAPAELVPAAEIVGPEALEVAGDLPEDAEAGV